MGGSSRTGGSSLSEGCSSQGELSLDVCGLSPSRLKKASRSWRVALFSSETSSICRMIFSVEVEARVQGKLSVFILAKSYLSLLAVQGTVPCNNS